MANKMFKRAVSMILSILMAAESVPVTSFAEETVPVRLEAEFSSGTVTAPNGTVSLNVRAELDGTDIPEEARENYGIKTELISLGVGPVSVLESDGSEHPLSPDVYEVTQIRIPKEQAPRGYRIYFSQKGQAFATESAFFGTTETDQSFTLPKETTDAYVEYEGIGSGTLSFSAELSFFGLAGKEIIATPYLKDPDQIFLHGSKAITASCKAAVRQELPAAVQEANPGDLNGWSVSASWKGGGTGYVWDAVEDELRTPSIMVQYRMENAPRTYEAGELSFTIPGIGKSGRGKVFPAKTTAGSGVSEWDQTYDSLTDTYTFCNKFTVKEGESTSGGFELSWDIRARESTHGYSTSITPKFTVKDSGFMNLTPLSYHFTSKRDAYRIDLEYDSAESLVPAMPNPQDYKWGSVTLRYDKDLYSRGLKQWKNRFAVMLPQAVPEGAVQLYVDNNPVPTVRISPTQYECILEGVDDIIGNSGEAQTQTITIGILKTALAGKEAVLSSRLERLYKEEASWITQAGENEIIEDQVSVTLHDYNFSWDGYIYSTAKDTAGGYEQEGGDAPVLHASRLPAYGVYNGEELTFLLHGSASIQLAGKDAAAPYRPSLLSRLHMPAPKGNITFGSRYPQGPGNTSQHSKLSLGKTWYAFLGDDKMAAVLNDGSVRNLEDDEYDLTSVTVSHDNWEVYAASSQDTPFEEYILADSGMEPWKNVMLPAGTKAIFVLYKNVVNTYNVEQQAAVTAKIHLDWQKEKAKPEEKRVDPEQRIINFNLFRSMYQDSDGLYKNDCALTEANYEGIYGTALAARDKALYGECFLRDYSHVWLREPKIRLYARSEIDTFTATEIDQYQSNITAKGFLKGEEPDTAVTKFSIYSEVPKGLAAGEITFPDKASQAHATLDMVTVGGKTYLAAHFDYTDTPVDLAQLQEFSFSYPVYENGTDLSAGARQYTSYTYIFVDDQGPFKITGGSVMADHYDLDGDGDLEEQMGYGADVCMIQDGLDEWRQYVEKHVSTLQSGRFVKSASASPKETYQYRLAFAQGEGGAKNPVLYDHLENGARIADGNGEYSEIPSEWKGRFLSVDTSAASQMGFIPEVWYSSDPDAPYDLKDPSWSRKKPETVASVAVSLRTDKFKDGIFLGKDAVYVLINMEAPSDENLLGKEAVNQYQAVYHTGGGSDKTYSLPSSGTYVTLDGVLGALKIVKTDAVTGERLPGASFNLYDTSKQMIYSGIRTDQNGILEVSLNTGTYYWEEKKAPAGFRPEKGLHVFTVEEGKVTEISVADHPTGRLKKVYKEDHTAIAGGTYEIYKDAEGKEKVLGPVTTDENGIILLPELEPGAYWFKELTAPEGYVAIPGLHPFVIEKDGGTTEIPNPKRSTLIKKDGLTSKPLSGGKFRIYDASGKLVLDNLSAGKDGDMYLNGLLSGTYYVEELEAPDGYLRNPDRIEIQVDGTGNQITIFNYPKPKLRKVDKYTKEPLGGQGVFHIYGPDGSLLLQNAVPDADGFMELPGNTLTPGTYYWEEVSAPDGYKNPSGRQPFVITDTGNEGIEIQLENDRIKGIVILTKKDIDNKDGEPLPDAGYSFFLNNEDGGSTPVAAEKIGDGLYRVCEDGEGEHILYTGSDKAGDNCGKIRLEGLNWGRYYFEETDAPEGYELNTKKTYFDVTKENTHEKDSQVETPQYFVEYDTGKAVGITVVKKDSEDGRPLAGAAFDLYQLKDGLWEKIDGASYETGEDGTFTANLASGTYRFLETSAPAGYILPEENDRYTEPFTVTPSMQSVTIEIKNTRKPGSVRLYKTDTESIPLQGAVYSLYKEDGTLVKEGITTGVDGFSEEITGLEWGNYYFLETKTPEHHLLSGEKVGFSISAADAETVKEVHAVDEHKKGTVELVKMDEDRRFFLQGAVFSLYKADGTLLQGGIITNADGRARIEGLEWGNYYFLETKAPENYALYDGKVEFSVGASTCESVQLVYCYDPPKLNQITIEKELTETHKEYGDGAFLYRVTCLEGQDKGRTWIRSVNLKGNKEGHVTLTGLYAGTYLVEELNTSRFGLVQAEAVKNFAVKDGLTGVTTLREGQDAATIKFTNEIANWDKDSHESLVENGISRMKLPVSLDVDWKGPDVIESETAYTYHFKEGDLDSIVTFDDGSTLVPAFKDLAFDPEYLDGSQNADAVTITVTYKWKGVEVYDTFQVGVKLLPPLKAFSLIYDAGNGQFDTGSLNNIVYKWDPETSQQIQLSGVYKEPSRTGYRFTGWRNPDGTEFDLYMFLKEQRETDHTVTAAWEKQSYTASFDPNGGAPTPAPITKPYAEPIGTLPEAPSRTGYSFDGWYTAAEGGIQITEDTLMPAGDVTYYAHWTVCSYQATFDANGGETPVPSVITRNYGEALGTLPVSARAGHTFNGWYTEKDGGIQVTDTTTMPAGNVTYYAHWTILSYTVTLDPQGGTIASWAGGNQSGTAWLKTYTHGSQLGTLPTPARSGYSFEGWYDQQAGGAKIDSSYTVTGSIILFAHWTKIQYTVNMIITGEAYADQGCTIPARNQYAPNGIYTVTVDAGTPLSNVVPALYYKGKKATGWCNSGTSIDMDLNTLVNQNYTIMQKNFRYADPWVVTFRSERNGYWAYYRWNAWDSTGHAYLPGDTVDGYNRQFYPSTPITLYEYKQSLLLGDTIGVTDSDIILELRKTNANAVGTSFNGWWSSPTGGTRYTDDYMLPALYEGICHELVVYAHW